MADLALGDQLGHRPDGLLDRDVRVDAVLVVEVDVVRAEALERALDRGADPLGEPSSAPTVDMSPGTALSIRRENLVAITYSSRLPLTARPTSSSFVSGP